MIVLIYKEKTPYHLRTAPTCHLRILAKKLLLHTNFKIYE
nr:MAG TPA: hypothetical protein [Bacteriophage sp.]